MPTIELNKFSLDKLLRQSFSIAELENFFPLAKAELKDYDHETGDLKVELNDTNRPDLWSLEGFARQIRIKLTQQVPDYPFFKAVAQEEYTIQVDPQMEHIRPFVGAFAAVGKDINEAGLIQLIQTQEKLSENFGRKRLALSIGIYELAKVSFPARFIAVDPDKTSFIPLGTEHEMTLRQILEEHPKGLDYRHIIQTYEKYPYFVDSNDGVLSFPPIINSRRSGEIKPGENKLFIEATGIDFYTVLLGLNIFACNLADVGFEIFPVETEYPYETPLGKRVRYPYPLHRTLSTPRATFTKALGKEFSPETIVRSLQEYGIEATPTGNDEIEGKLPPYRHDYLHAVDMIEDFAMSIGYDAFAPVMPTDFTVGRLSRFEEYSDKVRHYLVGYGFEEIISNILISRTELTHNMDQPELALIEVANPMSLPHSCLRNSIIPSLLRVEAASAKSAYPHKIFEVGEVVVVDDSAILGSRTLLQVAGLIAHPTANFSELDSYLTTLLFHLGVEFQKNPGVVPGFISGRAGTILCQDTELGVIGELAPTVLEKWNITIPVSVFELDLTNLSKQVAP